MHWHIHDEQGYCYGDTSDFDASARTAAEYTYPWEVPDADPYDEIMTIIDAPHCIGECDDEEHDD
jgi:hypothetical protein